ncbi:uncharacterized protein LOC111571427 isoform X1 [Amphiprion ocellaris]|uniref:uncharacterized protein LOC111571427 isoform X1 n=1 Tax=Amphiprion ocellaris TaxID=80972 RepID=UPI000C315D1E|nr:uncharacterized protein LOC111571427 isoform X1 [Amphiprion ocellaris]
MERSVIRLSHCQKEIFCFSLPDECPSCGEELKGIRLQEAPVSLPSPLTNGHKSSCCLLVAPAHDNLHRDSDGASDLHTGISNTKGRTHLDTGAEEDRQESCLTTLEEASVETRLDGSAASAFLWSDPTCSTCWPSGTSTWTASLTDPCGTQPGTVCEQRPDSRGSQLSEQRRLHSQLYPAEDEEGVQIHHAVPAPPETPVLPGGQTGGQTGGRSSQQLNQTQHHWKEFQPNSALLPQKRNPVSMVTLILSNYGLHGNSNPVQPSSPW